MSDSYEVVSMGYACTLGGLRRLVIDSSGAVSTSPVATPDGVTAELNAATPRGESLEL
ncbi:MAG: hypothetical protein ACRDRW_04195 [Pseudonocardiaceae bacterium]